MTLEAALAFVLGLLIGSFLNVCIYRLPRDLSVVRPRSFCVVCEQPISWFDNIPLVSFVLLRGRCRHCRAPISARYPAVELLTALLFFFFVGLLGPTLPALKFCLLAALLVGLIFADLEQRILPDELTLGGALAGLVLAWFVPVEDMTARLLLSISGARWNAHWTSLAESALGAALPPAFLWLGGVVFEKLRHKEGLGFGDVKMMAMIGAFLGLRGALLTLVAGAVLGTVVGLLYILITKKDASTYELPFGSFLGIAALFVALTGQKVIAWYAGQISASAVLALFG